MKIEFNTGRYYGPNGQRIEAVLHEGSIYFNDIDRRISGKLLGSYTSISQNIVMAGYDMGLYKDHAWRF